MNWVELVIQILRLRDFQKDKLSEVTMSEELGMNPKDLLGIQKVPLHLVPASSTIYQALAMADGAEKYGPYNWRENKVIASIYIAACMRHLEAWYDSSEECADDSEIPHLGHALACIGIIVDAFETGNLKDDRPVPGAAARLLKKWAKHFTKDDREKVLPSPEDVNRLMKQIDVQLHKLEKDKS